MFLSYHFFFKLSMTNCRKHPISNKKDYIYFWYKTTLSPKNVLFPKIIFCSYFGKYWFFPQKKPINEKYSEPHFLPKRLLTFVARCPLPLKLSYVLPQMVFRSFFRKYCIPNLCETFSMIWFRCFLIIVAVPNKISWEKNLSELYVMHNLII